jgi:hypothetical protein
MSQCTPSTTIVRKKFNKTPNQLNNNKKLLKKDGEIKTLQEKSKVKEFMTGKPTLQRYLEESYTEMRKKQA